MTNTKRCFCDDWEENIHMTHPDLGGEISIRSVRQWNGLGGYQEKWRVISPAKEWEACPWCASPLAESKEEQEGSVVKRNLKIIEEDKGDES